VKIPKSRLWLLILLLPVATVAGTVLLYQYGPPIFQLYILYSLDLLTHPLIALFLVLTLCTLTAVMILRYRHRSELLAFAFLFSAVLHLLTVAFFSLWLVQQPVVEMSDDDIRHEITTGLPSFSETMVGEDLRSLLQEIAVQEDVRELEARAETPESPDTPVEHEQAAVELPERDIPLPSRQQIEVDDTAMEQPVDEHLEALPVPTPDRDTTKLVHVEQIETRPEPTPKPPDRVDVAELEIEQTETPFTPDEQSVDTPAPELPEVDRPDYERDAVELAKATVAELRVEERLEERQTEQTVDQITMELEQEATPTEDTQTVEPTERNVSDAASYDERAEIADVQTETQTPDMTPERATLASAVESNPELPSFTRPTHEVAEDSSQVPATAADSMILELADERPLLPAEREALNTEPVQANPRELATDRVDDVRTEATPLADVPAVDAPSVTHVPQSASVEMMEARHRDAPGVSESLTAREATSLSLDPASAIRDSMDALAVAREAETGVETLSPARDLHADRTARAAAPALPAAGRPMTPQPVPVTEPGQATSLADTRRVQTAAPATALPTVSERPSSPMTQDAPDTITVAVGGRLMLVEASPQTTALRPAPLSSRDIITAYRRESPDSRSDVPLPETSQVAAPGDALSRVSQQSIMVSDSIRSLNPRGQAPEMDATLAQVMPATRDNAVNVSRAASTIAMPTTGSVVRARTVKDVQHFAQGRVAVAAPADDVLSAMPVAGHRVSPVPTQPGQATSLADTRRVQTAAPATALPTVSDRPSSPMTPDAPAAITVAVGGRLMLVEAAPQTSALQAAPLSSRDIITAYHRESPDSGSDVPLPETSQVAAPGDALSRVSQQSIMGSDSIRPLNPRGQAPEMDATLAKVMPAARDNAVNVSRAASTIAMPTAGSVVRSRTVKDVQRFAQGRVAVAAPSDDVPTAMPATGHRVSPVPTQTARSALRTTSEAGVGRRREMPRAGDEIDAAPSTSPSSERIAVAVAGHINQTAVPRDDRQATPSAEERKTPRDIRVARLQTVADYAASHQMTGLTAAPARTVSLPSVDVAVKGWDPSVPTMTEREARVDGSTVTEAPRLRVQPVERIATQVSAVPQSQLVVESPRAGAQNRYDDQALDVTRLAVARSDASLPEHGVPPPRTTFIARTPTGKTAGSRLPVGVSGVPAATEPTPTVSPSDRLASTGFAPSRALPVLDLSAERGDPARTVSAPGKVAARTAPSGDRVFSLSRRGSRRSSEAATVAHESGRTVPRPELSERAHDRTHVALDRVSDAHASVSDDVSSSAADRLRSLIAAEVAASRELPSKRAIYQLRSPDKRKEHIEALGGSSRTESAVEEALDWLASSQSKNGRWDVDDFEGAEECGGRGNQADADVGITGFTLLAFLGAGYTHIGGKHQDTVKKAIDWLVAGIGPDGDLRRGGQMYDQAMATTALCEAISLTGDTRLKPVAERAVQFILDAQNPGAAWRYHPRDDNDTSVTGWQILALKSAELAGITVPPQHYHWTELWLDEVRSGEEGGLYLYRAGHAVTPVMTAEGWFCQLFMGEQSKTRGQQESNAYVMQHLPVWSREVPGAINFYYWYYATLALHLSGSESFGVWNDALTTALLQGRVTEGPAAGTWDPASHIGIRGGRIYSTAVATLCLEVYYRFLPFYKLK